MVSPPGGPGERHGLPGPERPGATTPIIGSPDPPRPAADCVERSFAGRMTPMKLTGKVTLITNVSQFMGPACTEEFAKEGAILALHDRTEPRAKAAADVAVAYGREAGGVTGGLTRAAEANRTGRSVGGRFGRRGGLINNSSHPPVGGPVEDVPDEAWRSLMAHLLDEPFFTLRAAVRQMKRQGHGKIVNVTSAVALVGLPNYAAYTAARAATNGLTRAV